MQISTYLAAVYNCNAYGAGTYNNSDACAAGGLANTGVDFWIPLAIGVVLFISGIAFLVRSALQRKKQNQAQN
jgi:hypothetical protein